ncbi:43661_t:CDS:2, partial [Gigaspora margarita]
EGLQQEGSKSFSVRTRNLTDLFRKVKEQKKTPLKNTTLNEDTKTSVDLIYRSNEINELINDKDTFELPQRKVTETKSPENPNIHIRKTIEWEWVDTDWWIYSEGATNKEGCNPSSKGGFRKYTRRRKWAKTAKMIETIQKIENPSNSTPKSDEKIELNENTDDSCINNESSLNDHKIEGSSTQIKNPDESLSMKEASS